MARSAAWRGEAASPHLCQWCRASRTQSSRASTAVWTQTVCLARTHHQRPTILSAVEAESIVGLQELLLSGAIANGAKRATPFNNKSKPVTLSDADTKFLAEAAVNNGLCKADTEARRLTGGR
jgi:hypothetical protein